MKNIKKLLSIVMVLAMVLALGVNAFAAAEDKNVTITVTEKNGDANGKYEAYRLLDLTTADGTSSSDTDRTESGYSYTVNPTYREILQSITGKTDDKDIIEYIQGLTNEAAIRYFADKVFNAIEEKGISADAEAAGNVFSNVPQGYYLIAETEAATDEKGVGVKSLVMLDTAGRDGVTVTTKEDKPTSQKKVADINDSTETEQGGWHDSADYDIGDKVPFQLKGTLPQDYDQYEKYVVTFHDTSNHLGTPEEVTVTVDGVALNAEQYKLDSTAGSFTLTIDVKDVAPDASNGAEIVVEYKAELQEGAVIGNPGNPNEMYMEFTNDHYGEGTGETPKDKVVVFTYEFNANKVEPDGEGTKALEGAGFTLLKKVASGGEEITLNEKTAYEKKYEGVEVVKEYKVAEGQTKFDFQGLDDGEYILVESTVPDGYNKAEDIEFTITATHDEDSADPKLLTFKAKGNGVDVDEDGESGVAVTGKIDIDVVNRTGVELPETGGIGTTIFYVVGAILVVGAVILLVTKRRMTGAEK